MSEPRADSIRRTGNRRQKQRKSSTVEDRTKDKSWELQPDRRSIFIELCEAELIEKAKKEKEALKKRRKQIDCLKMEKERAAVLKFWADMNRRQFEASLPKQADFMKTQNYLALRIKNPAIRVRLLKDEVGRIVIAHSKALSARTQLQTIESMEMRAPLLRIDSTESKMHVPSFRHATLQRSKLVQQGEKELQCDFQISGWKTNDDPWLP